MLFSGVKSMVYVTGDLHGDIERFSSKEMKRLKKGDTLLVCGDFGFVWDGSKAEQATLKKLGKMKFNICFIDGVHENFTLLGQYPTQEWGGAAAQVISGNLVHLLRGEIYTIECKTIFAMGGGVSPDDDFREPDDARACQEIPSWEEFNRAADSIERVRGQVDYILTHEPPMKIKAFLQLKQQTVSTGGEVTGLNTFFEELGRCCTFKRWFFGSMHADKFISSTHAAVFRKVIALND